MSCEVRARVAAAFGRRGGRAGRGWRDGTLARLWLGLAAAGVAALPLHARASEATVASHCTAGEQTLFACSIRRKLLSVCATAELTSDFGAVQYRFGVPGHSALVLPKTEAGWRAAVRGGRLAFSGGGGATLAFENPP